jgi:hypothetical protein
MNVIKYGSQKKQQSGDSISYTEDKAVPSCDYCNKRGNLEQACRSKIADQKNRAKKHGKTAITVERARTIGKIANPSVTTPTNALTAKDRAIREEAKMGTVWEN